METTDLVNIWVDADSCPVQVRTMIARFASRLKIKTYFVANRNIPIVTKEKISKETDALLVRQLVDEISAIRRSSYNGWFRTKKEYNQGAYR